MMMMMMIPIDHGCHCIIKSVSSRRRRMLAHVSLSYSPARSAEGKKSIARVTTITEGVMRAVDNRDYLPLKCF